jgi:hypothetical protein
MRGRVLEVADMLGDDRAALANKADRRFEFRTHRHCRRRIGKPVTELNVFGRVASGAAQQSGAEDIDHDGIIETTDDITSFKSQRSAMPAG